jgi:hypothetical protein
MYYYYVEIEYIATSFSPARMDLALKLLKPESKKSLTLLSTNFEYLLTLYSDN